MEEKRKRGRPPGSGKKPKIDPFNPSKIEKIAPVVEDLMLVKEKLEQLKPKTWIDKVQAAADANKVPSEPPFPEGWEKLGKIEKLQWLTANRK